MNLKFTEPRGVQTDVIAAAQNLPSPALVILEAPTGIGKTETALYLADCWLQQHAGRGLYVAMPTQATSNQMYERIGDFLKNRYQNTPINYHLVHGQAAWLDDLKQKVELQNVGDDDNATTIQGESWFNPRKRTLLAPFGVGTVDQTLMSILQTRHFFVRLFGLSHKVIIFDEVHAYDTFMNTLFHRLLNWLSAIGTSVIILSATLPAETRRKLVEAYSGKTLTKTGEYPSLTIATANHEPDLIELPKKPKDDVTIQLAWDVEREPDAIFNCLKRELANGGCAAVICNTVGRAQDIYRVLEDARQSGTLDIAEDNLILFHARFPPVWRQLIEKDVLAKFGKPDEAGQSPHRPHRAIVVATQVIEQSLDLDFDLMLTDLAPIDLIIQRAGRLHRHERTAEERHGLEKRLVIIKPEMGEDGIPQFKRNRDVYEPYILLRSYLALNGKPAITMPLQTTDLIEAVYGAMPSLVLSAAWEAKLSTAQQDMIDYQREAEEKAKLQLVLAPQSPRLLKQQNDNLDEESPEVHKTLRAQTRDIDAGISLVCLHKEGDMLFAYTSSGKTPVNIEEDIPYHLINVLQQNTLTVQHKGVVNYFIAQKPPKNWQKEAALRHCRLAVFEDGLYNEVDKYTLKLTRQFGLEITKKEDA